MKNPLVLTILLSLALTSARAGSENCLTSSSSTFDDLANNVCTATSAQIADDLGKDKENFDKLYSGNKGGYQEKLIGSVSSVDAKAEKDNYKLWQAAQVSTLFGYYTFDEKGKASIDPVLTRLIEKTMGLDAAKASDYIDRNITPYAKIGKTTSSNGSVLSSGLQQKLLNQIIHNPEFKSTYEATKNNVKLALNSLPNNTFSEKDIDATLASAKRVSNLEIKGEASPADKEYWRQKYSEDNPFIKPDSQAYEVHYKAYVDYKNNLITKSQKNKNYSEKELREELGSIELSSPKKISFTPPEGVNIDDFFNKIKDSNPSYFNCKVSYTADASMQKSIIKNASTKPKAEEEVLSMPAVQAKTCKLQNNFGDDQYAMSGDMASEVSNCLKGIPAEAFNVQIDVQSCASTVRTNKEEFNKSNLLLSKKRSESIANLVPKDKGYALSLNFQGENKMVDENGNLSPTGTCGPWVLGVGDHNMDPTSCINSMKSSEGYCEKTPKHIIKTDGFFWLCNQVDGKPYTESVKESLRPHRFNTIKISYELKPIKEVVPSEKPFDPSRLPEDKKISYIESTPHITCLFPKLSHENWVSFSDRMKNSWRDFAEFTSSLSFPQPTTGESHVQSSGLCAAYH